MTKTLTLILLTLTLALAGCAGESSSAAPAPAEDGRLTIVTTIGQITDPTQVQLPEAVIDGDGDADAMCAVGVSGKVYCWGENQYGQVGDGSSYEPSPVVSGVLP